MKIISIIVVLCFFITGCNFTTEPSSTYDTVEIQQAVNINTNITENSIDYNKYSKFKDSGDPIEESTMGEDALINHITSEAYLENPLDIIVANPKFTNELLATGQIMSISEIREIYPSYGAGVAPHIISGDDYSIPLVSNFISLAYNRSIFENLNLALPGTYQNLMSAIEVLSAHGIVPISMALKENPDILLEVAILSSSGIDDYKATPQNAEGVPASWKSGLDFIAELREMGAFPVDTDIITEDIEIDLFNNGNAAMILVTPDNIDKISVAEMEIVAFPNKLTTDSISIEEVTSSLYLTKSLIEDTRNNGLALMVADNILKSFYTDIVKDTVDESADIDKPANTDTEESGTTEQPETTPEDSRTPDNTADTAVSGALTVSPISTRLDADIYTKLCNLIPEFTVNNKSATETISAAFST